MAKIAHIVLLGWTAAATEAQKQACADALAALVGRIPGLVSYSGGSQMSPEPAGSGIDFGFTMIFTDAAARDAYLPHPEHQRVIREAIAPILRTVQVLDYALAD
ncbi:Dabb family protein [Elstera cyanobacteriorum]|uniref:Dabb family protein n=1 Tax=Elstera cyanobacteriorum TaxID=2022747 RepID=UPI002352E28A|nr:Dabb family protein [Elstera cyanobacteriorum]MCK6443792.1 Dabb family protein [Elstera cyanobacteriorum]